MKVSEVMTSSVEFVPDDWTVQAAATTMAEHDIGSILVGSPERVLGILTGRDILLRAVIAGLDPTRAKVGEIMSTSVFTCAPDDPVESALAAMRERQVRRMPVAGENGRVVGIVTRRDLRRQAGAQRAR
jgi:CBS domain-containing protein